MKRITAAFLSMLLIAVFVAVSPDVISANSDKSTKTVKTEKAVKQEKKQAAKKTVDNKAQPKAETDEKEKIVLVDEKPALKMGMRGSRVELLQKRLHELGYYRGSVDGVFGGATFNAVYVLQANNGLFTDGVAGTNTIIFLNQPNDKIKEAPSADVSRGVSRGAHAMIALARSFLGTPYVWGGTAPNGFDCSGYIFYLARQFGVNVPRMADSQFNVGMQIPRNAIQAGDLVFFTTYEPGPSHVGIYLGDGNFIHASSAAKCVTITSLSKPYYVERYLGARRLPIN